MGGLKAKHLKAAEAKLHEVWAGKPGMKGTSVFSPGALSAKHDTGQSTAPIHAARAKLVCGTIFTLGFSNLYLLLRSAKREKKREHIELLRKQVRQYAKINHQKFALDEDWFYRRLLEDLGLEADAQIANSGGTQATKKEDKSAELNYVLNFLKGGTTTAETRVFG